MDILFENSYVRNKELAKEVYRWFYFKRTITLICMIVVSICFIVNIALSISEQRIVSPGLMIFIPLFFLFHFFCYFNQVKSMVKRDEEVFGGEIVVNNIVTDDFIQQTAATGSVNKIEYAKIKYGVQTKNLILLHSKANLLYIFRKDTFTKGTKDEFISFLKQKGVKIK